VDNGALSSCPAGEGHTWGKVSVEAVETGSVYVHTDVTAVFPWLTHALLAEKFAKRPTKRLMDHLDEAIAFLDADVAKQRKTLMKTLTWDLSEVKK
jgi:deoxyhypusine synthase